MPAKPGKSGTDVVNKYKAYVGRMTGPNTRGAMAAVLTIGITRAKELAPLEYGPLINSAYQRIEETQTGFYGEAGFITGYAYWLHERTDWNPRPPDKKAGPAWNPDATPKFLERGFTDSDQRVLMKKAIKDSYK